MWDQEMRALAAELDCGSHLYANRGGWRRPLTPGGRALSVLETIARQAVADATRAAVVLLDQDPTAQRHDETQFQYSARTYESLIDASPRGAS